eukprot:14018279-Alexandrium_andersonii.AAC.1
MRAGDSPGGPSHFAPRRRNASGGRAALRRSAGRSDVAKAGCRAAQARPRERQTRTALGRRLAARRPPRGGRRAAGQTGAPPRRQAANRLGDRATPGASAR